jgi:NitT/TauT family transport system substrate-binding protein
LCRPSAIERNLIAAFGLMQLAHLSSTCLAKCEEVARREALTIVLVFVRRIDGDLKLMKKLVLETTAPFQGLPELVADKEGLFAKEGLTIEWVERESDDKSTRVDVNTPKGLDPFASHGKMLEQGKADLYNACEWGNYCRVQDTKVGSRQVGRRGIVTYAGIVVRPDSEVFTAQQLAKKNVGVPFYFGTHYLALHLLEGFMPREDIRLCRTSNGSRERFNAMMSGEVEAVTLTEPYV